MTRLKLSWDVNIPSKLAHKWRCWLKSLKDISDLEFQRCVVPDGFEDGSMELHHFSDASEAAYGACSFLRIINSKGQIHVAFLARKSRLAPIKRVTIPRLELAAVVIASKLDFIIRRELQVLLLQSTFWTDSQITIAYIQNNTKRFKVFVANRVSQIHEVCGSVQWHHISGCDNPADVLSRGCDVKSFPQKWFHGPEFLTRYKDSWDLQSSKVFCNLEQDPEVKRSDDAEHRDDKLNVSVCISDVTEQNVHPFEALLNHYSSFYRMKKGLCIPRPYL